MADVTVRQHHWADVTVRQHHWADSATVSYDPATERLLVSAHSPRERVVINPLDFGPLPKLLHKLGVKASDMTDVARAMEEMEVGA